MFADLARRGLSHPNTVAYVKRAVYLTPADPASTAEPVEIPTWGIVLLYVSVWIALVGVTMVRCMHAKERQEILTQLLGILHDQPSHHHALHG
jgi:hypothetical protein